VYASPILSVLLGLVIAILLVVLLKPNWRDTGTGTVLGFGAIREARTWRVHADLGNAMLQAQRGDTILVAPGTYPEQLKMREGIAIRSERPREAVLQTSGVAVTADGIASGGIEGFRIVSDEGQPLTVGVQIIDSDIQVVDLEISGAQTAGIEIAGTSTATLRGNNVSGNPGTGLIIRDNAKPRIVHNTITNNGRGAGSSKPGIEIAGAGQPFLQGNTIANNAAEPLWAPQLNVDSLLRQNFVIPQDPPRAKPAGPRRGR
jgi:parallel beta-helix repeat protein